MTRTRGLLAVAGALLASGCLTFDEAEAEFCRKRPGLCAASDAGQDAGVPDDGDGGEEEDGGQNHGGSDGGLDDGGPGPLDAGDGVLVLNTSRYFQGQQVQVLREDGSQEPGLFVPLPDGGYGSERLPERLEAGVWHFPAVPEGEHLVRVGHTYVLTTGRLVDFGADYLGHPEADGFDAGTARVLLDVDGLVASEGRPSLAYHSPEVGEAGLLEVDTWPEPAPDAGTQSVRGLPGTLRSYLMSLDGRLRVPRTDAGESLWLVQYGPRMLEVADGVSTSYETVVAAGTTNVRWVDAGTYDVPLEDGGTGQVGPVEGLAIQASLTGPPEESLVLDVDLPAFAPLFDTLPDAGFTVAQLAAYPTPRVPEGALWVGYSEALMNVSLHAPEYVDAPLTIPYGNPYSHALWNVVTDATVFGGRHITSPDGGLAINQSVSFGATQLLEGEQTLRLSPQLLPPRFLRIDGQDGLEPTRVLSRPTPLLSWEAPAQGTPDSYRVSVLRLYKLPGGTNTRTFAVAYLSMGATRRTLTLPPGLLQPGETYVIQVQAMVNPGADVERRPFHPSLPYTTAHLTSGFLLLPGGTP